MKLLIKAILLLSIPILLASCGKNYLYQKEININPQGWSYQDSLNFEFNIADTSTVYNIILEIEHTTEYRFQNLYVQIHTKLPNGERNTQTLSLELAAKSGMWKGDCNAETCLTTIPLQEQIFFQKTGKYQITIEQFMRINPLKNVRKIALKIEKTNLKKQ